MAHPVSGLFAYFDPSGGALPPSMWGVFLAAILGAIGAALALLRRWVMVGVRGLWRYRLWLGTTVLAVVSVFLAASWYPSRSGSSPGRRVLVLALDGFDPRLLQKYMEEGRLPAFSELARQGVYHPLGTTTPPQSPVAWSSFWTGTGPEGHGVYDFFKRDPKTYALDLAISDRKSMRLPWEGKAFWEADPSVYTVLLRAPLTFPPPRLNGRLLAGMGVWDARGTQGTYFFYTTQLTENKDARGKQFWLNVKDKDRRVFTGELPGHVIAFQAEPPPEPFELTVAADAREANLLLEGKTYKLLPGRWSDWIHVEFPKGILHLSKMKLLTRALWENRDHGGTTETRLYIAPLNFDPEDPHQAITYPGTYAGELAQAIGPYFTRGMPFDTLALDDNVLSSDALLSQCRMVSDESESILLYELRRFQGGLLFAYFEEPDTIQHVYWRGIDPDHPLGKTAEAKRVSHVIPECYERCDSLLRRARAAAGPDTAVVVLSDHGFGPFRTAVHLNAILRDLGYLKLLDGARTSPGLDKPDNKIDWSQTRAYAIGFNSIYLNLAGREGKGIVPAEEAPRLREEIAAKLEAFQDPATGERPIYKVHPVPATGAKPGPDLIVGYIRGYRTSWESTLAAVADGTTEKNSRNWSGDHLIDPSEVPGVFLSSDRAIDADTLPAVGPEIMKYLRGQ